jgi:hypothetical protein
MVTRRQLEVLEQRIEALLPAEKVEYRVYFRWMGARVVADEDGTPSLPVRPIVSLDGIPGAFTDGKAYDEKGKECRWCHHDETDEEMMARHPELRGKDGKMRRLINLTFC